MITLARLIVRLLFRFRAFNADALKTRGPVLLLPNHVSWIDWLFLTSCLDTSWKFVTSEPASRISPLHRFIMVNRFTFPVDTNSPYAVKRMAEYLQNGGKLVLFPEGRLSRTGALMKIFDGTGFLIFKTNAKVITCYLRGAQRLPFSPNPNRKQLFPTVTAHFSDLLTAPKCENMSTTRARQKLTRWLADTMVKQKFDVEYAAAPKNILAAVVQTARQQIGFPVLEDIQREAISYRKLLVGAHLFASEWRGRMPAGSPERIGVMLPSVLGMPVTLLSLWAAGKVPAILNFTTGTQTMLTCAQLAGLKQIITSKLFLERAKINLEPFQQAGIEIIYLEDVGRNISGFDKLAAAVQVTLAPASILPDRAPETALVLFTSGSEGVPKGVELTHANLLANVHQLLSMIDVTEADRLFNALPLFHCFGIIGLLVPLIRGCPVFLYPSPLHYRVVPTLIYDFDATIFFATNTFLNGYARKANPFDFRSLRILISAAEKLQEATASTWARKYGVRILEGYGATECSPCVTINTALNPCFGSAGQLLPGMDCRFEPVEGVPGGGRLWVRGPNVMRGYLNPEANEKFLAEGGWYDTGDIARLDEDGFLHILGRMKRFAKVSGEMVSLTAVEEALAGAFPQYGLRFQTAILTKPDADRGEMLLAVANDERFNMDEMRAAIKAKGLSNLSVPREIKYLRDIPKLGTGKVDYRQLQTLLAG